MSQIRSHLRIALAIGSSAIAGGAALVSNLLLESGDNILLESGDFLLTE